MRYYVTVRGVDTLVEVDPSEPSVARVALVDPQGQPTGRTERVRVSMQGPSVLATVLGERFWVTQGSRPSRYEVLSRASRTRATVVSARERAAESLKGAKAKRGGASSLRAPMPGRVVRILVAEGDTVAPGQPLVAIEAMKMQNELLAELPGVVARVAVRAGDSVEAGAELIRLTEPKEPAS